MVWIPALKICLCFARSHPENLFFREQQHLHTVAGHYGFLRSRGNSCFVGNKFMSSCHKQTLQTEDTSNKSGISRQRPFVVFSS